MTEPQTNAEVNSLAYPVRKRLRLKEYDYSSDGYYFVTVCARNKQKLFGEIRDPSLNTVQLSPIGKVIEKHIQQINRHYDNVSVDKYVVMPNHIHLIVVLGCEPVRSRPNPTLGNVIGLFKSGVSRELGESVWQRLFHDHVIRTRRSYEKIWEYIDTNPAAWEKDCFYV